MCLKNHVSPCPNTRTIHKRKHIPCPLPMFNYSVRTHKRSEHTSLSVSLEPEPEVSRMRCQSPTPQSSRNDETPPSVNRQLSLYELWEYHEKAKKNELIRRKKQAKDRNHRLLNDRF